MNNGKGYVSEIVYPDGIERYDNSKNPRPQKNWITRLLFILASIILLLVRRGSKIEKINTQNLKPPYILLANHMQFLDFCTLYKAVYPHKAYVVGANHTFYIISRIMEALGCMYTRKFTADISLVRGCHKVLKKYNQIFAMYPEARYTPDGTESILPEAVGKLAKTNKVPVVIMLNHGNYLNLPFWGNGKHRKTPIYATYKQILTAEQVENMTVEEINRAINEEFRYDEYRWQKENDIHITEPTRAEGLHKVLYKCPHCLSEGNTSTKDSRLKCESCGKEWEMTTLGEIKAIEGETEISHIPHWYRWEREQVRRELLDGAYYFEDEVQVYGFPGVDKFIPMGKGRITHNLKDGFVLTGHYNGQDYRIERSSKGLYSLHIEYGFSWIEGKPELFEISTKNDSFYCVPTKKNVVTKLALATEEACKIVNEEK